jgi:hypothetical protein
VELGHLCTPPTFERDLANLAIAEGDKGDFCGDKEGAEQDEREYEEYRGED